MRIAIFVDSFYPVLGGMEDATAILARSLGEAGYDVDLYVPSFSRRNYTGRRLPIGDLDLGAKVKTYHLFSLPLPYYLFAARLIIPIGRGYRLLKNNRPDLIHAQSMWGAGLEALWASSWLKIPFVGTNHAIISEFGAYFPFARDFFVKLMKKYEAWFYNHCLIYSTPSMVAEQAMKENGVKRPSRVISNIIDTENFKPIGAKGNPWTAPKGLPLATNEFGLSDRPIVCFAGRFAIEKRVEILLQAIKLVREQKPEVVLALAGAGVQQKNWEKLIAELGIEANVKFIGSLGKPQLAKLFQASAVFAIASPVESQGMVALQAMACGLPVVGVNGRAIPEYVNEENGFIVAIDDYRAMADCLVKLLNDQELAQKLGEKGREKVEKYSKQNIIKEWEELYNFALNNYHHHAS